MNIAKKIPIDIITLDSVKNVIDCQNIIDWEVFKELIVDSDYE